MLQMGGETALVAERYVAIETLHSMDLRGARKYSLHFFTPWKLHNTFDLLVTIARRIYGVVKVKVMVNIKPGSEIVVAVEGVGRSFFFL
jgi:hypothetical protein